MSTAAKCVCRQARQVSHRTQWLSYRQSAASVTAASPASRPWHTSRSSFSSSTRRAAEGSEGSDGTPHFNQAFFDRLHRDDQAQYRGLRPSDRKRMEQVSQALEDESSNDSRQHRQLMDLVSESAEDVEEEFPETLAEREPRNQGFFQMGEKEEMGPDDEFQEDDITTIAHKELEQHREKREYARLASYEMPLLANLAIPFIPPTAATPLRFRFTTYMGEQHPASRKIVVEFCPTDLGLTQPQVTKLIKLSGPRYNPNTEIVRMSCESFETQAQNKRYLGDTVQGLIREAKDTADMFDDLPFDFRHVKQKRKLQFPEQWLLTEERKLELDEKRRIGADKEAELVEAGGLISGVRAIEEGRQIDLARVEAPIMAQAQKSMPKGKQGKRELNPR